MSQPEHGGQVYAFARKQSVSMPDAFHQVLDFSASINPIQPNIDWQSIQKTTQFAVRHYPDTHQVALKNALSKRFKLPSNHITLTNGISSAIVQLFSQIKPDTTLLFSPIYSEYERAADIYSNHTVKVQYDELEKAFSTQDASTFDLSAINQLTDQSVVVLVNPSTPKGDYYSPSSLEPLLKILKEKNCWIWVDESFLPFIGWDMQFSLRGQLKHHSKMVILQSLTKYYACPGVRIGALFSSPKALENFVWPSWPLSVLDEQFMLQALQEPLHNKATQTFFKQERPRFIEFLKKCAVIQSVKDTKTNFVFVITKIKAVYLTDALKMMNILIRDCQSFGLGENTCRIAIRSTEDNQKLIHALHSNAYLLELTLPSRDLK